MPEEVKAAGGFLSWGDDMDLLEHAGGFTIKNKTSGYVSTSFSLDVAKEFAEHSDGGYIYKILKPKNGIDVNVSLGNNSPMPWEKEWAVPRKIPVGNIKAVTPAPNK